jgi:hypothetical protein
MGGAGLTVAQRSKHGDVQHRVSASLVAARPVSFLAKQRRLPAMTGEAFVAPTAVLRTLPVSRANCVVAQICRDFRAGGP